ncbi:MAG: hypothetical protein MJ224_01350 [archaeon]|nr:hypothetical protein [archaeon]
MIVYASKIINKIEDIMEPIELEAKLVESDSNGSTYSFQLCEKTSTIHISFALDNSRNGVFVYDKQGNEWIVVINKNILKEYLLNRLKNSIYTLEENIKSIEELKEQLKLKQEALDYITKLQTTIDC